jgi:ABC-type phosphate/phosphonate transport system substrate-binding protein
VTLPIDDGLPVRFTTWLTPGIDIEVFELASELMSEALGRPVILTTVADCSGPGGAADFLEGRIDLGWMCSSAFVQLPEVDVAGVAWVPRDDDALGGPVYFSDLVVAEGCPATGLADLAGRRVACNDPLSLSGHVALCFALADISLDEQAIDIVFTGGHLASFEALDAGDVDVAAVDSVTRLVHRPDLAPIERLGPWPTQPLVAAPSFGRDDRRAVCEALVGATASAESRRVLEAAGLSSFALVDAAHYDSVASRFATWKAG